MAKNSDTTMGTQAQNDTAMTDEQRAQRENVTRFSRETEASPAPRRHFDPDKNEMVDDYPTDERDLPAGEVQAKESAPTPTDQPKVIPYRAKFTVTEISKSNMGTATITLRAAYDHTIDQKNALIAGANPQGELKIVISEAAAARIQHNSAFFLISA